MPLTPLIQQAIIFYLAGDYDLLRLLNVVCDAAVEAEEHHDTLALDLINTVKHYYAELTGAYLDEAGFKDLLRPLVRTIIVEMGLLN